MKQLYFFSALLMLVLVCTNRQNPISSRDNQWDSGGTNFTMDGKPQISGLINSLVWHDFNHQEGCGTIKATYAATDPNLPHDSITCRFFLGAVGSPMSEIYPQPDSTLLLEKIQPKTTYRCSLTVADKYDNTNFFFMTFISPVLIPPLPPVPTIASVGDTIKIRWTTVASASGYRIYSSDSLQGPYLLEISRAQPASGMGISMEQPFPYKIPGAKYYIVASFNTGGESRSHDTLHGIIISKEIAAPGIDSISKGSHDDFIKVAWHANDAAAVAFEIYRSVNDTSSFKVLKRVGVEAGQNVFIDSVATTDVYHYKIAAINRQGYSSHLSASDYGFVFRISAAPTLSIQNTSQFIGLYWNIVPGTSRYAVYRNAYSCNEKPTLLGKTDLLFYNDTVVSASTFYYSISAIDSSGVESPLSNCVSGTLNALSAPKGFTISNQLNPNALTLTWETLPGAQSYIIYRSTTGCPKSSDEFQKTANTVYIDKEVVSTTSYYYAVAAVDNGGRPGSMSMCSDGSIQRLSSPGNVLASNGTYSDYIMLSWNALSGAGSYVIYRSNTSCWENKTKLTTTTTSPIIDSVPTSAIYYYVVAGIDKNGTEGSPSACTQGRVKQLPAPTNLRASNGEYSDGIHLSWNEVTGATGYVVYSSTSSALTGATARATVSTTSFIDSLKTPTTMYYWVAAVNRLGPGLFSGYAYGSIASPPVLAVTKYTSAVVLAWKTASATTGMTYIKRSSEGLNYTVIDSTNGSTYSDNPPDFNPYNYQVVVRLASGSTATSNTVPGYKLLSPPEGLTATDQSGGCLLKWKPVPGIKEYSIYKSETSGSNILYRDDITDTMFYDAMTVTTRYYYRVASRNSFQRSSVGTFVIGGILQTSAIPIAVKATGTPNAIVIYWDLPSGSSTPVGYYIMRSTSSDGRYELLDSSSTTSYSDSVTDSSTYYYRISSYNQNGSSKMSEIAPGKLQPPAYPSFNQVSQGFYSAYIRLSWTPVAGTDSVGIYRATYSNGGYTKIGTTTDTVFFDTSAVPNTRYYYRLTSFRRSVEGPQNTQFSGLRLGPPTYVEVQGYGSGIYLSWPSVSVKVRMYYIYRSSSVAGPFTKIDSVASRTDYVDSNEFAGNNYYRISASNLDESPMSPVSSAARRPFPEPPYSVIATRGTDSSKIAVSWQTVSGAIGYKIFRSMDTSFLTTTQIGTSVGPSFTDTVPSDSFYYYKVKSYNNSGESSMSYETASGFRIPRVIPIAPAELDTLDAGPYNSTVILIWNMPSNTVAFNGFRIYRSTSLAGTYTLIDETLYNYFEDIPPSTFPTVYWYKVVAYNAQGESAASNTVSATRR